MRLYTGGSNIRKVQPYSIRIPEEEIIRENNNCLVIENIKNIKSGRLITKDGAVALHVAEANYHHSRIVSHLKPFSFKYPIMGMVNNITHASDSIYHTVHPCKKMNFKFPVV